MESRGSWVRFADGQNCAAVPSCLVPTMRVASMRWQPEFVVACHARGIGDRLGWWWFAVVEQGRTVLEAQDYEPWGGVGIHGLALVRALESLPRPARVLLAPGPGPLRHEVLRGVRWAVVPEEKPFSAPARLSEFMERLRHAWSFHQVRVLRRLPGELEHLWHRLPQHGQLLCRTLQRLVCLPSQNPPLLQRYRKRTVFPAMAWPDSANHRGW